MSLLQSITGPKIIAKFKRDWNFLHQQVWHRVISPRLGTVFKGSKQECEAYLLKQKIPTQLFIAPFEHIQ